jgi:hypothetical protein
MRILGALVGGLVGSGCGIAVVVLTNVFVGYDGGWLGLIIGVLTGSCVGYMAHGTEKLNYIYGTIAAVLTLAAIVLGKYATASVFNARTAHLPTPATSVGDQPDAKDASIIAKQHMETLQERVYRAPARPRTPKARRQRPSEYETAQVVWLGLATLVAYYLGRSGIQWPVHQSTDITAHGGETGTSTLETT